MACDYIETRLLSKSTISMLVEPSICGEVSVFSSRKTPALGAPNTNLETAHYVAARHSLFLEEVSLHCSCKFDHEATSSNAVGPAWVQAELGSVWQSANPLTEFTIPLSDK